MENTKLNLQIPKEYYYTSVQEFETIFLLFKG